MHTALLCWLLVGLTFMSCDAFVIGLKNGDVEELGAVYYTTLGKPYAAPAQFNVTIIHKSDLSCNINIDPQRIHGHFLVYADYLFGDEDTIFDDCLNYFYDSISNGVVFARIAQQAGAVGVITRRNDNEEPYTKFRMTGVNGDINIPILVTTKSTISKIVRAENDISYFEISPISSSDRSLIKKLRDAYNGLRITNCILYPILTVLTAYFGYLDLVVYINTNKKQRSIHPALTKAAPFVGGLFISIWLIADPYSFKLTKHFPAVFFERLYFGFMLATSSLLLKTWILAVGNKLKSQRAFRISIIIINTIAVIDVVFSALWAFIGKNASALFIVFGALTAFGCGVGYIYYGKDIVIILSKGGKQASYRQLSIKVVVFTVVFVAFIYVAIILFFANSIGAILSELLMQLLIGVGFITIYLVLFFRKSIAPESPHGSKASKSSKESGDKHGSHSSGMSKSASYTSNVEVSEEPPTKSKSEKEIVVIQV